MKILKKIVILSLLAGAFLACSDDDTPEIINEEEVITTLTATLTPLGGGTSIELKTFDGDGDGPNPPVVTVSGNLLANTSYNGSLDLLNETVSPAESITDEIAEEDDEHQFFFQATNGIAAFQYNDQDDDGNPIGLSFTLNAGNAGTGTITITLRHEPNKSADGVSDGDITNAGGETDISATFPVVVE
ncbi:type 1 periplasmic binding fold superfamily protein [Algibacter mikhailovii]|uniref:type 1 periplasmic binding fold superfamily protein n=1 Tax=Algibacter mikhailovii TaxID=425498 RepID=UPI0024958EA4|nr:type 1 periplasmic binding fold superfamily protein [Algibacter mikhailovii]